MKNFKRHIGIFTLLVLFVKCSSSGELRDFSSVKILEEFQVTEIPLADEISGRDIEISGLCWNKGKLILLPQYPDRFEENNYGKIFYLDKSQIDDFISGKSSEKLKPQFYKIDLSEFSDLFQLGSGFEAATVNNDTIYFSIESLNKGDTETFLLLGKIDEINHEIVVVKSTLTMVTSELKIHNLSGETIVLADDKIFPIYEANGKNVNPSPEIAIYDKSLKFIEKHKFPRIEYRITDATEVDENGKFWAINYLYPGDFKKLEVGEDPIIEEFGIGRSHQFSKPIERLIELQFDGKSVNVVNRSPIYLELMPNESRNWEGLAKFDGSKKGFLIATDTFPKTILGFIEVK